MLNRMAPFVEPLLIREQAGFRPGKSCTSQLLNPTQHIKDGYQRGTIMGAAFVDQIYLLPTTVNQTPHTETLQHNT